MKRTVSILLSALLIFNSLGYVVFYHQVRYQIRSMMRNEVRLGLGSSKVETVRIYYSDIRSKKIDFKRMEKREFRLDGQMYDVVKEEKHEDFILFYCIKDIKETALNELFACLAESNSAQNKSQPAQTVLKLLIKDAVTPFSDQNSTGYTERDYASVNSPVILERNPPPAKHPPKILFA